jgi:hypothetical protein
MPDLSDIVTLGADENGQLVLKSQVQDYALRGAEYENMNFLDFVVETYEERLRQRDMTDVDESSTTGDGVRRGRIPNERSQYQQSHPRYSTHGRVSRSEYHNTLPDIVGPWFPRRDDEHRRDLYFASMLALLRPWHRLSQLKQAEETWEIKFTTFVESTTERNQDVMAGIQYYYESKKSAEDERNESAADDNGENTHECDVPKTSSDLLAEETHEKGVSDSTDK